MARTAFLHPFARPTAEDFTTIVRGEGALVWDAEGRRYVDAIASLWYCNVGHGRPEMAEAVARQLRTLENYNTFDRYTNEPAEALCAELAELAPMERARVFLTTSGSEAVDTAVKLARLTMLGGGDPDRELIVTREGAYHGVTYGGMSLQGLSQNREGFGPLLGGIVRVPRDDLGAVEKVFADQGDRIAAVIAEPVLGAGGVHTPVPGYLEGLRRLCDDHGALLILDEVICGFGRLGEWWGADRYGVRPDMQTFAKGVSSGYLPLGGVVVGPAVLGPLEADPEFVLRHGHTYSGHPACCVAGSTNIDILRREGLLARATEVGGRLGAGLLALADEGLVAEARGDGAIWAVDLHEGTNADALRAAMLGRGVIARNLGERTYALCPPLVIEEAEVDFVLDALRACLVAARPGSGS